MGKIVQITVDDDKEIQTIIFRPLASALAAQPSEAIRVDSSSDAQPSGTSTATATATFSNGQSDVTADVNVDL